MTRILLFLFSVLATSFRSRLSLQLENAALQQQLATYRLKGRKPRIASPDRLLWCVLARWWPHWREALVFVQPRTVTLWQRKRFREHWRALSLSGRPGRPKIAPELRDLIRRMWQANPTWGSPRIVAELHMLGIEVAKSTVEKYKPSGTRPPSPTWRTFLNSHRKEIVAIDFFTVPTLSFKVLFVFVVLSHDRRQIVHVNVTEHPTAHWTAQQLVEAFPFNTSPRFLVRDGDSIYGERVRRRINSLGIHEVVTAQASPWQNAYVERVIGTLRRELLDHVIVLNERHLKRLLSSYLSYYHPWRTHRSLDGDAPDGRSILSAEPGQVVEIPLAHGLHHYYLPRAA